MKQRAWVVATTLTLGVCWAASDVLAQPIEHARGNIVSIDQDRGTVELRDPKNRVTSWRFRRDARVEFTDGAAFFPHPTVRDLRPPMYVHYTFVNEVIGSFDVVELGFRPGDPDGGGMDRQQGVSRTVSGLVSAYDPRVRQVAVDHHGKTEAFQLTDSTDRRLEPGTRVELRTEWSGARELVAELRVLREPEGEREDDRGNRREDGARRRQPRAYGKEEAHEKGAEAYERDGSTAEGRVVRIESDGVVMEVAGARETYAVSSPRLLRRLRVGETVRFDWEESRGGRLVITRIR